MDIIFLNLFFSFFVQPFKNFWKFKKDRTAEPDSDNKVLKKHNPRLYELCLMSGCKLPLRVHVLWCSLFRG